MEELLCAEKAGEISNNPLFLTPLPVFDVVVRNQLWSAQAGLPKDYSLLN